jgi:hypothetical protein
MWYRKTTEEKQCIREETQYQIMWMPEKGMAA